MAKHRLVSQASIHPHSTSLGLDGLEAGERLAGNLEHPLDDSRCRHTPLNGAVARQGVVYGNGVPLWPVASDSMI